MFYPSQSSKEDTERRSAVCKGNSVPKRRTRTHLSEAQQRAGQCSGCWRISPGRYWEPRLRALPTWLDPHDKVFKNHGSFFISLSHDHRRIWKKIKKKEINRKTRWFSKLFPILPKTEERKAQVSENFQKAPVRHPISKWRTKPTHCRSDATARKFTKYHPQCKGACLFHVTDHWTTCF